MNSQYTPTINFDDEYPDFIDTFQGAMENIIKFLVNVLKRINGVAFWTIIFVVYVLVNVNFAVKNKPVQFAGASERRNLRPEDFVSEKDRETPVEEEPEPEQPDQDKNDGQLTIIQDNPFAKIDFGDALLIDENKDEKQNKQMFMDMQNQLVVAFQDEEKNIDIEVITGIPRRLQKAGYLLKWRNYLFPILTGSVEFNKETETNQPLTITEAHDFFSKVFASKKEKEAFLRFHLHKKDEEYNPNADIEGAKGAFENQFEFADRFLFCCTKQNTKCRTIPEDGKVQFNCVMNRLLNDFFPIELEQDLDKNTYVELFAKYFSILKDYLLEHTDSEKVKIIGKKFVDQNDRRAVFTEEDIYMPFDKKSGIIIRGIGKKETPRKFK